MPPAVGTYMRDNPRSDMWGMNHLIGPSRHEVPGHRRAVINSADGDWISGLFTGSPGRQLRATLVPWDGVSTTSTTPTRPHPTASSHQSTPSSPTSRAPSCSSGAPIAATGRCRVVPSSSARRSAKPLSGRPRKKPASTARSPTSPASIATRDHLVEYTSDGEVRQEFTIVLTGRAIAGDPTTSDESSEVAWVSRHDLDERQMTTGDARPDRALHVGDRHLPRLTCAEPARHAPDRRDDVGLSPLYEARHYIPGSIALSNLSQSLAHFDAIAVGARRHVREAQCVGKLVRRCSKLATQICLQAPQARLKVGERVMGHQRSHQVRYGQLLQESRAVKRVETCRPCGS